MKKIIGIIGTGTADKKLYDFAYELGKNLAQKGFSIVNGGLGGIMEAVCKGFSTIKNRKGNSLCIIPYDIKEKANPFCDYVIPTGMGIARNILVVRTADILIALGGGSGTLSEIAFAWQLNKKIIAVRGFGGWSEKLAEQKIDNKYNTKIYSANSIDEIFKLLNF